MAAASALLAPVVALIPPHAPWAIGMLAMGVILARRRWSERFTLVSMKGSCPRCEGDLDLDGETRLRPSHPVACEGCRHEATLEVDLVDSSSGPGAPT